MSQIQASATTKASLQQPFHIYYSPFALVFVGLIVTFSTVLFGFVAGIMLIMPGQSAMLFEKSKATGAWVILVMAVLSILSFLYPRAAALAELPQAGHHPLAWRNIERNIIRTIYSPSGPTISILRLRSSDGKKIGVYFGDLKINAEDYERLCDLYQAEAEARLRVAA